MMYFFIFVIVSLWPQCRSIHSDTIQVVVVRQEEPLENNKLSEYVRFENITDGLRFNFTILKAEKKKYEQLLNRFCTIAKNTGVSMVISEVSSFQLLDVYASYMAIPLVKLFHNEQELVKQVRYRVIRFGKK